MATLGGVSEVAEVLGLSRQRVAQLRERPDFPDPVVDLASGPVWDLGEVRSWLGSGVRQGPGRPKGTKRVVGRRFELEEPAIASGGFGQVYRALDRKTNELVAVKVLKDVKNVDDEAVLRFKRELRLMKEQLDHPHVMTVIDHGDLQDLDSIWCAMPLAAGSLAEEIKDFRGDHSSVVDLARQLCAGLNYVHDAGVLHRDLKPGNILRTTEGVWAISDFGLAREVERQTEALTSTLAQGMGTIVYASPEQWARPKTAEVRDDVFSLGKILQHAITGELPMVPAYQIPESPLRAVIQRATGPRNNRYDSARALLSAIEQAVNLYDPTWEAPADREARLHARVASPTVDSVALDELLGWLQQDDLESRPDDQKAACRVLVNCSREGLAYLWRTNSPGFRHAYSVFADWVQEAGFGFDYCDVLADFAASAAHVTDDNDILRNTVTSLAALGCDHNRWHVRTVSVSLLQNIRDHEHALVALEGLQAAEPHQVRWTVTDFVLRSLHPALRSGVAAILKADAVAS